MSSVAFYTLGCKLNFSESSSLARSVNEAGFTVNAFENGADIFVINTCSVTEQADKKCRRLVSKAKRSNPGSKVVIVGCYAQLKPREISEIDGVDMVLGAAEKFNLVQHLQELDKSDHAVVHSCEINTVNEFRSSYSIEERTRSFLKVQDGCDYSCSFCTIPLARGKSRSDDLNAVIRNAEEIAASGIKEIVLTGINLGDYRNGGDDFLSLIQALDNVDGIDRYRISSIEPNLLSDEIIDFVARSKKFMPHFHIPLQSGSDRILGQMRRRYKREVYASRVKKIKDLMPHACIGMDVIVGFPGETEQDFEESRKFIQSLDVSYLHVFTYSERANTLAADMEQVPMNVRRTRNTILAMISEKKKRYFYDQHAGSEREVLFEGSNKDGWMTGFTDNYIKIKTRFDHELINQIVSTELERTNTENLMLAEPVKTLA